MNNITTLITGGGGMLGESLKKFLPNAIYIDSRDEFDLTKRSNEISSLNDNEKFNLIIHCAAYTDLSFCEKNEDLAFKLHSEIIPDLQKSSKKLIYISTNPTNSKKVYYKSKKSGEQNVLKREDDLVIRTNIYGNGGLIKWAYDSLIKQKEIYGYEDVLFNPVYVDQLSEIISGKLDFMTGILSIGSSSCMTKYDFIKLFAKLKNLDTSLVRSTQKMKDKNLIVPFEGNHLKVNLMDGLLKLIENENIFYS